MPDTPDRPDTEITSDTPDTGKQNSVDYSKYDSIFEDDNPTIPADTQKVENDPDAKDTPNPDSEPDGSEEYTIEIEEDTDEALAEKLQNANRGITAKFQKLDADYKAKTEALSAREKELDTLEKTLIDTLADGLDLSLEDTPEGILKLIEKIPAVRKLKESYDQAQEVLLQQAVETVKTATYNYLGELGYSSNDVHTMMTRDNGKLAERYQKLLASGLTIEEAVRALGISPKTPKTPAPTSVQAKSPRKSFKDYDREIFG